MRVIQLVPTLAGKDAIGNEITAINRILISEGFESLVFSFSVFRSVATDLNVCTNFTEADFRHDDIVIFHVATGSALSSLFYRLECTKIMIYHNITPPNYFEPYDLISARSCRFGLQQTRYLSEKPGFCFADSEWNKNDLRSMGYTCPIDVLPVVIPFDDYRIEPSPTVLNRFSNRNGTNLLFVGRIAPNKKYEDIIKVFACYKKRFDSNARLFLVGAYNSGGSYYISLLSYVAFLGVNDVYFTGSRSFDELIAYYSIADVLLCQSEHEGFCVPLIEAMLFDLPVVAYDSTAVGETLGGAGALLDTKDPLQTAAVVDRVVRDADLRAAMIQRGRARLKDFEYDTIKQTFVSKLEEFLRGCR